MYRVCIGIYEDAFTVNCDPRFSPDVVVNIAPCVVLVLRMENHINMQREEPDQYSLLLLLASSISRY